MTQEEYDKDVRDKAKEMAEEIVDERIKKMTSIDISTRPKDEAKAKDEAPKFKSFGEQLQAVAKFEIKHELDPRLKAASGLNEGVGAEGGFLVEEEFTSGLLMDAYDTGVLAKECWQIPMTKNALTMKLLKETSRADGSRRGGILTYWEAEAATVTASKPEFRLMKLGLNKLIGLYYATDELLEDGMALGATMKKLFAEDFGFKIDDAVINGTGAGMPLGMLNGAGLITQAKVVGQDAATVVADNVISMWNRMPAKHRSKAKWYINQDVEPQLMKMFIEAGLGGESVFMPPGGLISSPSGILLGRPVEPIEQCSALGTAGDIIFADMSQYALGQKAGGIKAAASIHVMFLTGEQTFRFTLRLDGQPVKNSALTPYKGTTTRSPYVTLIARS